MVVRIHQMIFLLGVFILSGCASFHPETESTRIGVAASTSGCTITIDTSTEKSSRPCSPLEDIDMRFDRVVVGKTTFGELRKIGFGAPYSTTEMVPAPEVCNRLTKMTDRCLDLLDTAVKACILHPNAAYVCKLAYFTNGYSRNVGINSNFNRLVGLNRVDVVNAWSWEAGFVLESPCVDKACPHVDDESYVVVYKQLKPFDDPPGKRKRKLSILDSGGVDLTLRP